MSNPSATRTLIRPVTLEGANTVANVTSGEQPYRTLRGSTYAENYSLRLAPSRSFSSLSLWRGSSFCAAGEDAGQEQPQETPAAIPENASEPIETNLTFEAQDGEGDAYAIRMGEYEWEGTKGMNGDVEEVVLEGRTAAHFTTAVRLADGEITTGVFGRAEPDRPLWHATYQRTTTDGQRATTGTYQAIEKKRVILEGAYTDRIVEDRPGDEPDVIVRDYVEEDPREGEQDVDRFRAKFEAEEGTVVPWLPGNPIAEGGAEGEAGGNEEGGEQE